MARMLPDFVSLDCKSNAERRLFSRFRDELPDDWTVLHSLGLAKHHTKLYGEADFVVICEAGILVIEVKGGKVQCEMGKWYFTNRFGEMTVKTESPMAQAKNAMFALRNRLRIQFKRKPDVGAIVFGSGVFFPDIQFKKESIEWDLTTVADRETCSHPLKLIIDGLFRESEKEFRRLRGSRVEVLSGSDQATIIDFLRGDFCFIPRIGTFVDDVEMQMIRLSSEQFKVLDMLMENRRVVVHGVAGTGKTILAFEKARRHASNGEKVLLLCFNRLLARQLKRRVESEGLSEMVVATTLHSYCMSVIEKAGMRDRLTANDDRELFQRYLPDLFPQAMIELGIGASFDVLVVDEGQDFRHYETYFELTDLLLKGGHREGSWAWFEDDLQSVFFHPENSGFVDLSRYNPALCRLVENWRNTRAIVSFTSLATGAELPKCMIEGGMPVECVPWDSKPHQKKLLEKTVHKLLSDKVAAADIIILSAVGESMSIMKGIDRIAGLDVVDYELNDERASNAIRYASIYKFKGLEAKVVILTDVEGFMSAEVRIANYVGMTRANAVLIPLVSRAALAELEKMAKEFGISLGKADQVA